MKEIKAYIRKEKAEIVIQNLEEAGVTGMTVLDAAALAQWADDKFFSYSIEYVQKYSSVVKIELVCEKEKADEMVSIIQRHGHTGRSGDGWIFVSDIERAVRIKNGEEGKVN